MFFFCIRGLYGVESWIRWGNLEKSEMVEAAVEAYKDNIDCLETELWQLEV